MAKKYELITELYERTRQSVTEPQQWQRFLSTAAPGRHRRAGD